MNDSLMMVNVPAPELVRKVSEGTLLEAHSHNLLVYDKLNTLRDIFIESATTFLPRNEILLLASQYETPDAIKQALEYAGIDVSKYLADGSLFVIDAQQGYQGADQLGTFKLALSLVHRAKKEGRAGVTWFGDVGSFIAFGETGALVDYELFCPTKYEDTIKTVCCYHKADFNVLKKTQQEKLIRHHFKSIIVE